MNKLLLLMLATFHIGVSIATAEEISLLNKGDFTWETTAEGVAFAPLQGDRFKEAYQALVNLPAGTVSPPHIKTANMYGMLLEGEMIHYPAGADPKKAIKIKAGSYYRIASGFAHVSACISETACIAYLYQDGPFDFKPVK